MKDIKRTKMRSKFEQDETSFLYREGDDQRGEDQTEKDGFSFEPRFVESV